MKKKASMNFIVFIVLIFFVSCNGVDRVWYFLCAYNAFDSTHCVPMNYTLDIINNTGEDSSLFVLPLLVPANAQKQCVVPFDIWNVDKDRDSFSDSIINSDKVTRMAIRESGLVVSSKALWHQAINDDTVYYGISTIVLYEETDDGWNILWDGAGGEIDRFIRCYLASPHGTSDDWDIEEYLPDVGGDFYYYLDPEKSGTESFGRLYSTVSELDGMESGNIKIQLTIDKDSDGKKTVSFAYLGVVED